MNVSDWIGVAGGGILGAWMRFFVTNRINRRFNGSFPLATFLINVTGAFLLGYLYALTRPHTALDTLLRSDVGIGFIGSYTTFSTFSYESVLLYDRRARIVSFAYVGASIACGLAAAGLGAAL